MYLRFELKERDSYCREEVALVVIDWNVGRNKIHYVNKKIRFSDTKSISHLKLIIRTLKMCLEIRPCVLSIEGGSTNECNHCRHYHSLW